MRRDDPDGTARILVVEDDRPLIQTVRGVGYVLCEP
jgi:DNA-binding response OmpR family regulator